MVYFSFTLFELDSWDVDDYFTVKLDSKTFTSWKEASKNWGTGSKYCATNKYVDLTNVRIFGRAAHSSSSLALQFIMGNDESSMNESAGFRNLKILFTTTTSSTAQTETMCAVTTATLSSMQCKCSEGYYYDTTSGSCKQCNSMCSSCFGSSAQECYVCASGAGWSGTACVTCDSSCSICRGTAVSQCDGCTSSQALYNSKYCMNKNDCTSPLSVVTDGCSNNFCNSGCSDSDFVYWDSTCISSCDLPLVEVDVTSYFKKCTYPCGTSQALFSDGTCASSCGSSFNTVVWKNRNFCFFFCNTGEYLYWNKTCSTVCNSPLKPRTQNGYLYCDYPCTSNQYLYWNGTCGDSCDSPFIAYSHGDNSQYCDPACGSSGFYFVKTETCVSSCNSPYRTVSKDYGEACLMPCDDPTYYYYPNTQQCKDTCSSPNVPVNGSYLVCLEYSSAKAVPFALVRILQHTRYLNIEFPPRLKLFASKSPYNILSMTYGYNLSQREQNIFHEQALPSVFSRYGMPSSFLVNFWRDLVPIVISICIALLFLIIEIISSFCQSNLKIKAFLKLGTVVRWNFTILLIAFNIDHIILFTVIEFKTLNLSTLGNSASFIVCVITLTCTAIIFITMAYLSKRSKTSKIAPSSPEENLSIKMQGWSPAHIMYSGFRSNSRMARLFYLIYITRLALPSAIASSLYSRPLIQAILYLIISVMTLSYVCLMKPLSRKINQIQLIIIESIVLVVNICLLTLTALSAQENKNKNSIVTLGDFIIAGNIGVNLVIVIFLLIKVSIEAVRLVKLIKTKQKIGREIWLRILVVIVQQASLGFEELLGDQIYENSVPSTAPKDTKRAKEILPVMVLDNRMSHIGHIFDVPLAAQGQIASEPIRITNVDNEDEDQEKQGPDERNLISGEMITSQIITNNEFTSENQLLQGRRPRDDRRTLSNIFLFSDDATSQSNTNRTMKEAEINGPLSRRKLQVLTVSPLLTRRDERKTTILKLENAIAISDPTSTLSEKKSEITSPNLWSDGSNVEALDRLSSPGPTSAFNMRRRSINKSKFFSPNNWKRISTPETENTRDH